MPSNSFLQGSEPIPRDYRTPSPPIRFHEPLSPNRAVNASAPGASARRTASSYRATHNPSQTGTLRRKRKSSGNTAHNGTDNIALLSLPSDGTLGRGLVARDSGGKDVRPSKRSKANHITAHSASPPQQAQWSPSAVPVADAELLLNFSQRACSEATPANRRLSGTSAKLQSIVGSESPVQNRAAAKTLSPGSPAKPANGSPSLQVSESHQFGPVLVGAAMDKVPADETETLEPIPQPMPAELKNSRADIADPNGAQPAGNGEAPAYEHDSRSQMLSDWDMATAQPVETAAATKIPAGADLGNALPTTEQLESPPICAGCNLHRNTSAREAEFEANSWICCDGCKSWFHFACAGFKNEREVRSVDKFRCKKCKAIYGPTTYVRKSSRAHSAIDYAGLNEGIVKTSDESPEHHYIKPIKEGTIKFDPEMFARMRPELVTKDFFERGDGMKEPIVIPAHFNSRPRFIPDIEIPPEGTPNDEGLPDINDSSALEELYSAEFEYDQFDDNGQDALGMVIPQGLTVRKVSELYGPEERIEVIDVKSQNGEDKKWNMKRWVDYYESTGSKVVRNVISLEVSQSPLGRLIQRPKVVRDLDLQDSVWPADLIAKGDFPKVQFYCLMSVADCYTDFHIDFGGSSVYYHILKGKKTFFFIPPHEKHLKKYEEWCNSPAQNWTFLGDQTKECYRVDLSAGDTMLIPAGWIHAVWTPEDSLVIGGNFLTRMHYPMQIRVAQIEKATHVARKFRYPFFQKIMWYTALRYLEKDPLPETVAEDLTSGQEFHREIPTHLDYDGWGANSADGPEYYHARYYSKAELDGLPELGRYLQRTALIAMGSITDGITAETRNAVKRSIPKMAGDPFATVKKFALWYSWKRGDETIPHWAYPDYVPESGAADAAEKKLSARTLKRLDREAALQAWKVAPDRQSTRVRTQPQNFLAELASGQLTPTQSNGESSAPSSGAANSVKRKVTEGADVSTPSKKSRGDGTPRSTGPRRPACEACRKSRRACKHRDELPVEPVASGMSPNGTPATVLNSSPTVPNSENALHSELVKPNENGDNEEDSPKATNSGVTTIIQAKPSGRNKACKDCRKSKRRCVHDEFGNDDPVKLAEAALPRPAAKKRKPAGDGVDAATPKKGKKTQVDSPVAAKPMDLAASSAAQAIAAQALFAESAAVHHMEDIQPDDVAENEDRSLLATQEAAPVETYGEEQNPLTTSPGAEVKYQPEECKEEAAETQPGAATSLVSPPESAHTDGEQSPRVGESKQMGAAVNSSELTFPQATSTGVNRYTPDSGPQRRASTTSVGKVVDVVEAISPSMEELLDAQGKRRGSRLGSESEADEESMRLIRELAAQDMGLRRRAKGM